MLEQMSKDERMLFLKLFTKELLINSISAQPEIKQENESFRLEALESPGLEELEIRMPQEEIAEKEPVQMQQGIEIPAEEPDILPEIIKKIKMELGQAQKAEQIEILQTNYSPSNLVPQEQRLPIEQPKLISQPAPPYNVQVPQSKKFAMPIHPLKQGMAPSPELPAQDAINLKKLNLLASDHDVSIIECPGPDKLVLVKKNGQINLTKVSLSQEEMNQVIRNFSEKSRIPLMEGVFKARVGNFTISAIITQSAGSSFIIYKSSPYNVLESI